MTFLLPIPDHYRALLTPKETERVIRQIKEFFQTDLAFELNLIRVTAPLFVEGGTGVNDDLNGAERPVAFAVKGMNAIRTDETLDATHSLYVDQWD